jgi:hypothetical protein
MTSSEPLACAFTRLARFFLAVPRWGMNLERMNESAGDRGHVVDRVIERRFVGA